LPIRSVLKCVESLYFAVQDVTLMFVT